MSPLVRLLQKLTLALALFAIVTAGGDARATGAPFGISGTSGENVGTLHEIPSSGALPYAVSFSLPPNRGSAQPSLGLAYASGARNGEAGWGWSLTVPSIERAPLWGWPRYLDPSDGDLSKEDRYTFDGAPLTFVCVVGACADAGDAAGPTTGLQDAGESLTGYRYYRRQVESGFERFFLNPTRTRWIVQRRGGEVWEMGSPKTRIDLQLSAPYDVDFRTGKIFRWNLAVQRDLHGDRNLVYYQWAATDPGERKFLRNVYYVPPAANTSTAPLSAFAYHVELRWEGEPSGQRHYTFADKRPPSRRLRRVAISAKTWGNEGERELVRAYNLAYHDPRTVPAAPANQAPLWGRSSLKSVQLEGRCPTPIEETAGYLPDPTDCLTLPATTFEYQAAEINVGAVTKLRIPDGAGTLGGIANTASATVVDIDRTGLPDIISPWPTNFTDGDFRSAATCPNGEYKIIPDDLEHPDWTNPRLVCVGQGDAGSARRNDAWLNHGSGAVPTDPPDVLPSLPRCGCPIDAEHHHLESDERTVWHARGVGPRAPHDLRASARG